MLIKKASFHWLEPVGRTKRKIKRGATILRDFRHVKYPSIEFHRKEFSLTCTHACACPPALLSCQLYEITGHEAKGGVL